ncbi:hypothetical protein O3M35_010750 [Rhynocoris fuscipes]|uniref:Reverse transcriptase zinc-binding domain-containing protein n=1 Tax=Rhynocoris fuscipes TaxID=488301 RepID=A0AAW1D3T9_9HEMI
MCTICNVMEEETLEHFLFVCPAYSSIRLNYIKKYIINVTSDQRLIKLLKIDAKQKVKDLFNYCVSALKIRAFIVNKQTFVSNSVYEIDNVNYMN